MVSRNVTGALLGLVLSGCSTPRQEQRSIDADPFTGKKVAILYPHNMGPSLGQSEALHQQFTPLNPELVPDFRFESKFDVYFSTWEIITDYNHLRGNVGIEDFKLKKMEGK